MNSQKQLISLLAILFFCLLSPIAVLAQNDIKTSKTILHTVKKGETAYSISKQYNLKPDDIFNANKGASKSIKEGQILSIPLKKDEVGNAKNHASTENNYTNIDTIKSEKKLTHMIKPKETLYSVSRLYDINVTDLINANKDLSEDSFKIGRVINIPSEPKLLEELNPSNEDYVLVTKTGIPYSVEKGETLYSISKKYGITIAELLRKNPFLKNGLKEGTTILIPYLDDSSDKNYRTNEPGRFPTFFKHNDNKYRIAVLLPFKTGSKLLSPQKITEYYEGFLLSVLNMKNNGFNAEIFTFDIGADNETDRLESILGTNEMNSLDLVIGGISDAQVRIISNFSKRTGVKYVVPFNNKNTGVDFNPNMFQVVNSQTALSDVVIKGFLDKYKNFEIIFLPDGGKGDKSEFISKLKTELQKNNIKYSIPVSDPSITVELERILKETNRPVVIIPSSSSETMLRRVLSGGSFLKKKNYNISVFGYPEWQIYKSLEAEMFNCNTTIYSSFYLSENIYNKRFDNEFKKWYNKNIIYSIPQYAPMGYDLGMLFLSALSKFGDKINQNINLVDYIPLEIAYEFKKTGPSGGYVNDGLFFITYSSNGEIKRQKVK